MPMQMIAHTVPATAEFTMRNGSANEVIPAGKHLVIETSPSGTEIFNEEVPVGKRWTASIFLRIKEEDT